MIISLSLLLAACAQPDPGAFPDHPEAGDRDPSDPDPSDPDPSDPDPSDPDPSDPDPSDPDPGDDEDSESETDSGDDARIIAIDFPGAMDCGALDEAIVVMENTGTTVWSRDDGFKLGAVDDEDPLFDSGDVRVWMDEGVVVEPGEEHEFVIDLLGTDAAGIAHTDWQMVHEGVHWFGEIASAEVTVECDDTPEDTEDDTTYPLPLPDMSYLVNDLAAEHPEMLADSCLADGGSWDFLDTLVDRLREIDERWGYNWKRGVVGDASQDVVDYHYGPGDREGSTDVYIMDVIIGHCGGAPAPGWTDQTEATADAGTIGMWTGRDRF